MKRNFFKFLTIFMVMAVTTVFLVQNGWSDTKKLALDKTKIQAKKTIPNTTGAVQLVKKSNPYPSNVWAYECPCKESVEPAGGILMKGVIVRLRNIKCPGTPSINPVNGKVKFSWYDLKERRNKYVIKPFTNLISGLNVEMMPPSQTILASKSSLLIAEIIEINGVKDCNLANTVRIATCVLEPVY